MLLFRSWITIPCLPFVAFILPYLVQNAHNSHDQRNSIKIFEQKQIRSYWDDDVEKWCFSIVDVITVLTESVNPNAYWRKLKQRLIAEGNETVTNCHALKMPA